MLKQICVFVTVIALGPLVLGSLAATAQHTGGNHPPSKYTGQEKRDIKSLSPDDLKELRRGGGWGLAKAAELNGVPGPAHLLEMKDKIALTPEQVGKVEALFNEMRARAVAGGKTLIAAEQALEAGFRSGNMSDQTLRLLLADIAKARSELRFIHLSTHLRTPAIISASQIKRYNVLRGYAGNPCAKVPKGHNAAMWRKHNGCE